MRKSEPDSKHFGKSLGNLRFLYQNLQKPPKMCVIIYCVVSYYNKRIGEPPHLQVLRGKVRSDFERTVLKGYWELGGLIEMQYRHRFIFHFCWWRKRFHSMRRPQPGSRACSKFKGFVSPHDMPIWSKSYGKLKLF